MSMIDNLLNMIKSNIKSREFMFKAKDYTNALLVKKSIKVRQRSLTGDLDNELRNIIRLRRAHDNVPESDVNFEMYSRLNAFRSTVIPWLESVFPLSQMSVLEIGCGSCSSTVALAEQGCRVTAIDIDPVSLKIAESRLKFYGLDADVDLRMVNASNLMEEFTNKKFNLIIFFASLEHMTLDERLGGLQNAWTMLSPGGYLCVIETPNRLWIYDEHTSSLPFFEWLPDALAIKYAHTSPKLKDVFSDGIVNGESLLRLVRSGRGLSFHEFEVAGIDCSYVESCMVKFLRRNPLYWLKYYFSYEFRYSEQLRKWAKNIDQSFFYHRIDVLIRKPTIRKKKI